MLDPFSTWLLIPVVTFINLEHLLFCGCWQRYSALCAINSKCTFFFVSPEVLCTSILPSTINVICALVAVC
jgi:hypothetical protein